MFNPLDIFDFLEPYSPTETIDSFTFYFQTISPSPLADNPSKKKLAEITPFLEDVLTLSYPSAWQRLFDRLGGFFSASFGPAWQIREKKFREQMAEGKPMRDPVILKK